MSPAIPAIGETTRVPPPTGGPDPEPPLSRPQATITRWSAGPARKVPPQFTAGRDSIPSNPTPASIMVATGPPTHMATHTTRGLTSIRTVTASDPWQSRNNSIGRYPIRTGAKTDIQCHTIRPRNTNLPRRDNPNRPHRRPIPPDPLTPIIRGKSTTFDPWRNRPGPGVAGKDHTNNPIGTWTHIP